MEHKRKQWEWIQLNEPNMSQFLLDVKTEFGKPRWVKFSRAPMIIFKKDFGSLSTRKRQTWKIIRFDGKLTASIVCPDCGQIASLLDHDIDADGIITPSLVCPNPSCDFHNWGTLEGWSNESK